MADRIDWIDRWRGILIAFVVLGHVVGAGYHLATGTTQITIQLVYKAIYSFHMPAFFILAGMTWKDSGIGWSKYIQNKALRLLVPYLFFGLLSAITYVIFKGQLGCIFSNTSTGVYNGKGMEPVWQPFLSILHGGGWPNGTGFQCNSVLWFLPCFFSVSIVFYFLRKIVKWDWLLAIIGVLGVVLDYSCHATYSGLPMGLDLVPRYLFFMIVGHLSSSLLRKEDSFCQSSTSVVYAIGGIVFLVVLCYWMPDMYVVRKKIDWLPVYCLVAVAGSVLSAYWATLLNQKFLMRLGQMSLGIMLFHKFIVIALQNRLGLVRKMFTDGGWVAGVAVAGVTLVSLFVSYYASCFLKRHLPIVIGQK